MLQNITSNLPKEIFFNPYKHHITDLKKYILSVIDTHTSYEQLIQTLVHKLDLLHCRGATDYYEGQLSSQEN